MEEFWYFGPPHMAIQTLLLLFGVVGAFWVRSDALNPHSGVRRKYFRQLMGVSGSALFLLALGSQWEAKPGIDLLLGLFLMIFVLIWALAVFGFGGTAVLLAALGSFAMFQESRWKAPQPAQTGSSLEPAPHEPQHGTDQ